MPDPPLVLTLTLDPQAQEHFDRLRREHFPPGRNVLAAHVTLFHALPGARRGEVERALREVAVRTPPFDVAVTGVRSLGRGVAYDLRSPRLDALRAELAGGWRDVLTPQDRQRFAAHVTVQNKVTPDEARAVHARLSAGFEPWAARATGLDLWSYLGGPWRHESGHPFAGGG